MFRKLGIQFGGLRQAVEVGLRLVYNGSILCGGFWTRLALVMLQFPDIGLEMVVR